MKKAAVPSILIAVVLFALGVIAEAQQPTKIPRIGYLAAPSLSSVSARTEALGQGLRELGYIEGKNIVIEWRYAERKLDRTSSRFSRFQPSAVTFLTQQALSFS